jgi:hypothetical protein
METVMINTQQRESTVRRALTKGGFRLRKRDDGYMVIDLAMNAVVSGSNPLPYADSLADVEAFATTYAA